MKSVKLEWSLGELNTARQLLDIGVKEYPDYSKLWMMYGQIETAAGNIDKARSLYNKAVGPSSLRRQLEVSF